MIVAQGKCPPLQCSFDEGGRNERRPGSNVRHRNTISAQRSRQEPRNELGRDAGGMPTFGDVVRIIDFTCPPCRCLPTRRVARN